MSMRRLVISSVGLLCASLAGCAGSGAGLDNNGRPIGSEGGGGTLTADFQSIQANVFTPICSVCHAGGAAPQGLRLDAVNSYSMIVGVPSAEDPSVLRIKAGDPDNSYLVQKIEGHASVGAQMPFGGPALPAATIAVIRQWVSDGALPAPAALAPAHLSVVAAAPATGDVVLASPAQIIVSFSADLDRGSIAPASLRLERLGGDSSGQATEIPVRLDVPAGNSASLLVTPRERLGSGRYRLTLAGRPGIADVGGRRLGFDADVAVTTFAVETAP
jgi:methionine-rich copper-binding protein CopC